MAIGTAAAILGAGALGAGASISASNKAAKAQQASADAANATQLQMYNQTRQDNAPWREVGGNALNELAIRLGVPGGGGSGSYSGGVGGTPINSLAGATLVDTETGIPKPNEALYASNPAYRQAWDEYAGIHNAHFGRGYDQTSNSGVIEQFIRGKLANQMTADITAQREEVQKNPLYGSLMRDFTLDDMNNDPVYKTGLQFGLDQGTKAINAQAAATGNLLSGATVKAQTRYGNDYGSTKANESFNRFSANRDSKFNKLATLAGVGQVATNTISSAGQNMANRVSENQTGIGNARAASAIGGASAMNDAIGTGMNWWQYGQAKKQPQQNYLTDYIPEYARSGSASGWNSGYDL